jgi:membrane-associated protein
MEIITWLIDFVVHLDKHLIEIIQNFGIWSYVLIFLVIFVETGVVVFPFLPGDSLIFMLGALAASGDINIVAITLVLMSAAIIGDTVNYHIGKFLGPKVFQEGHRRFFKMEHLVKTQKFYEKHGGKTIILARFMPIVRTFAPFVAGIGMMRYLRFLLYNAIGGICWVLAFTCLGFFFGNIPFVRNNFSLVGIAIILLSVLPIGVELVRSKMKKKQEPQDPDPVK